MTVGSRDKGKWVKLVGGEQQDDGAGMTSKEGNRVPPVPRRALCHNLLLATT